MMASEVKASLVLWGYVRAPVLEPGSLRAIKLGG